MTPAEKLAQAGCIEAYEDMLAIGDRKFAFVENAKENDKVVKIGKYKIRVPADKVIGPKLIQDAENYLEINDHIVINALSALINETDTNSYVGIPLKGDK